MGFLMNRKLWLTVFLVVFASYLVTIVGKLDEPQLFLKPLLLPALGLYFASAVSARQYGPRGLIYAALFFSWAGDVLLMFQHRNPDFFLFGLCSFLLAHIFYIIFFFRIMKSEHLKFNGWLAIPVSAYYCLLIYWLAPYLGDMKHPVMIYGLFISLMLLLSLHVGTSRKVAGGNTMMYGAILFVISDSLLAINKFYRPVAYADFLIILTYGAAQLLIVIGAATWIKQANTR